MTKNIVFVNKVSFLNIYIFKNLQNNKIFFLCTLSVQLWSNKGTVPEAVEIKLQYGGQVTWYSYIGWPKYNDSNKNSKTLYWW